MLGIQMDYPPILQPGGSGAMAAVGPGPGGREDSERPVPGRDLPQVPPVPEMPPDVRPVPEGLPVPEGPADAPIEIPSPDVPPQINVPPSDMPD